MFDPVPRSVSYQRDRRQFSRSHCTEYPLVDPILKSDAASCALAFASPLACCHSA